MPISHRVTALVSAVLLCSSWTARAEMGTGTVQDPVTYQYLDGVTKDWQEGIVLDPNTGNYLITYKIDDGIFASIAFEPATKIAPTLSWKFEDLKENGVIRYRYALSNGRESKQGIKMFRMVVSGVAAGTLAAADNWEGSAVPTFRDSGQFLSWSCWKDPAGCSLAPGDRQGGFVVDSNDLPGITMATIKGRARPATWIGEYEPSTPVGRQILDLTSTNDFVGRLAVAPRVPVPTPFDTAAVLRNIQKHVDSDLVKLGLVNPSFAAELDRWFQAAIAAASGGNLSAVRNDLNELHRLLEREHKGLDRGDEEGKDTKGRDRGRSGLIDRLAAQVLAFDLKYVEHQLRAN